MPKNEKPKAEVEAKKEGNVSQAGVVGEAADAKASDTKVEETKGASKESDTVEVSKDDLAAFMKRLNDLEADKKKLFDVADKGRMFQYSEKERAENNKVPTVKVTTMGRGGKVVVAWKMLKNESYVDGNRLIEHQEIEVFYKDGESAKMPLLEFYRNQNKETVGRLAARTTDNEGTETLKLDMKDGSVLEIGSKFVN